MKRIGFIGLGIMGVPMVRNLCKAGMDVTIIENGHGNKEAIAELKEKGVHTAPTARETARNQDVVITMLPKWTHRKRYPHRPRRRTGRHNARYGPHRLQLGGTG